jgi:HAD superfamily hydrolase (TIGR01509 family)
MQPSADESDVTGFDAVLFDMDGVIVDSERHWVPLEEKRIFPEAVAAGGEVAAAEITGMNYRDVYDYLAERYETRVEKPEFVELYDDAAAELYGERAELMPGFPDLLADLRVDRADRRVALVSSSPHHWIRLVTDRFDLKFDAVVSAEDVAAGKPDPAVYERAADELGVPAGRCVAVEDSEHGVESAARAGAVVVGYRTEQNRDADLSTADVVVEGPGELRDLLLG